MRDVVTRKKKKNKKTRKTTFFGQRNGEVSQTNGNSVAELVEEKRQKRKEQNAEILEKFKVNTKKDIKQTGQKYAAHKTTEESVEKVKKAAILPANETNDLTAKQSKTDNLSEQKTKTFDKSGFRKKLKTAINGLLNSQEDAEKIASDGVGSDFKNDLDNKINQEKNNAGGDVETANREEPTVSEEERTNENPIELKQETTRKQTKVPKHKKLSPPKKDTNELAFSEEKEGVDSKLRENNLTDEKLDSEPKFHKAKEAKNEANQKTEQNKTGFEEEQDASIQQLQTENRQNLTTTYDGMQSDHVAEQLGNFNQQSQRRSEENAKRIEIRNQLNTIYNETNDIVQGCFTEIDRLINEDFENALKISLEMFESVSERLIDDNDGWEWLGKKLTGRKILNKEEIFKKAKDDFVKNMMNGRPEIIFLNHTFEGFSGINSIADKIGVQLEKATQAIANGKKKMDKFWSSLSKKDKEISEDLYTETNEKFAELEAAVEEKESSAIESITAKFEESLNGLQEKFDEIWQENLSLWERAKAFVNGVINTIKQLRDTIRRIAKKAAKYAGRIMDDPIGFFKKLGSALSTGFKNFKKNIDKHLIKGALMWLTGSMASMGLEMPEKFDFKGIVSLLLQILGINEHNIKKVLKVHIGKKQMDFLENAIEKGAFVGGKILEIFLIIKEEGVAGLWTFIKEQFSNLKEMLINAVIEMVTTTVVQKAVEKLLLMLIPVSALIEAARMLISFVTTLFQKAGEILQIIEGILDSFGDILDNKLGPAAQKVEDVLGGFVSLAINFLAAILGLNKLAKKVQTFIKKKIKPRIQKALHAIAKKVKKVMDKLGITKLINKAMKGIEKGKDKLKKAGGKFLEILGLKKKFKQGNETHTLVFKEKGNNIVFGVHSQFNEYQKYVNRLDWKEKDNKFKNSFGGRTPKSDAVKGGKKIEKDLVAYKREKDLKKRKKWGDDHSKDLNKIAKLIENYTETGDDLSKIPTIVKFKGTNRKGYGKEAYAKQLSTNYVKGQDTGRWGDKGSTLSDAYETVKLHKKANFVRGHLLNGNLGGRVNNTNLTPITKRANSRHLHRFEKTAKKLVIGKKSQGDSKSKKIAIRFMVQADYRQRHNIKNNIPKSNSKYALAEEIKNEINSKDSVPKFLNCVLWKLEKKDNQIVPDESSKLGYKVHNNVPDINSTKPDKRTGRNK